MRASEFASSPVMAKIERTGQIVQILRHEDHVKFSDEPGWLLVNTEPGRRTGTGVKWIPDSTRFAWVKNFESLKERKTQNYQGIDISISIDKDDEYVDDDDVENQTMYVQATSGGKELGHVLFTMEYDSQGLVLNPQDLEVDERFRGQGIAAIMYDYVKSQGYRIRRSGQQTDAGRGFWQKHRPSQNVWETEAQTATARQVLDYINKTHHEPFRPGEKMYAAVMAHPRWELKRVPLLNLNIPDQEYDDVDYDDQEPESDPYGRVMMVEPGHAGEVSQHLIDKKPIVIDADRYIIDGNHRAWAAKYLLNRDYINAWMPSRQIKEVNYPDELTVSDRIQEYFFQRGYELAGEGRDQMAFESPRGTIVKVLGTGDPEREQIVRNYVKFFEQNQQNSFYPRIYSSGEFAVDGETYFVYEMERVNYVANEEATLDYIEKLMSAVDRGQGAEYVKQNPVPDEIGAKQLSGLLAATEHMMRVLGGQAPLDLSAVENLGRRNNGHLVIVDPYSL